MLLVLGGTVWAGAPLQFRTRELPRAVIGSAYRAMVQTQVDGRCPSSDVVLEVMDGSLPRGIELAGQELTGIPKEFGLFKVRMRAVNGCAAVVEELPMEVTGKPILRVTPEEVVFEYREGDALPKAQVILVSGSWADMAYTVRHANAPWLRVRPNQGTTPFEGSPYAADAVTVQVAPEGLAPGVYHAVMSFSMEQGANMPQISVTFRVVAK